MDGTDSKNSRFTPRHDFFSLDAGALKFFFQEILQI